MEFTLGSFVPAVREKEIELEIRVTAYGDEGIVLERFPKHTRIAFDRGTIEDVPNERVKACDTF